jgi:hypothetical protein
MRSLKRLILLGVLASAACGCGPQANTGGGSTNPPGAPAAPPAPPPPPPPPGR